MNEHCNVLHLRLPEISGKLLLAFQEQPDEHADARGDQNRPVGRRLSLAAGIGTAGAFSPLRYVPP